MNLIDKNSIQTPNLMQKLFQDSLYQTRPRRKNKKRKKFSSMVLPGMDLSIVESIPEDNDIYPDDKNDFYFNAELLDNQQYPENEESFIFIPEQLETLSCPREEKSLLNEFEPGDAHEDAEDEVIEAQLLADHVYSEDEKDFYIEAKPVDDHQDAEEDDERHFIEAQLLADHENPRDQKDIDIETELVDDHQDAEEDDERHFIEAQLLAGHEYREDEKDFYIEAEPVDDHQDAEEDDKRQFIEAQLLADHKFPENEKEFDIEAESVADFEFPENVDDFLIGSETFDDLQFPENNENRFIQTDSSFDHHYRRPKIEVPVLIAQPDIEVDLARNIDIPQSISSVVDVNWRVRIINSQLIVPTRHFFVNGVLMADIQYMSNDHPGDICITSVNIPWKKVIKLEFIYPPILPVECNKREYKFKPSYEDLDSAIHREQIISHSQHSISNLLLTRVVSTEHIQSEKQLGIQLNATFSFNILQHQLVDVCR
jgi:hypothetical protein